MQGAMSTEHKPQMERRAAELIDALFEHPELEDEGWTLVGKLRLQGNEALANDLVKALRSLEQSGV